MTIAQKVLDFNDIAVSGADAFEVNENIKVSNLEFPS